MGKKIIICKTVSYPFFSFELMLSSADLKLDCCNKQTILHFSASTSSGNDLRTKKKI